MPEQIVFFFNASDTMDMTVPAVVRIVVWAFNGPTALPGGFEVEDRFTTYVFVYQLAQFERKVEERRMALWTWVSHWYVGCFFVYQLVVQELV